MEIIRNDDGSLTVPVAHSRQADDDNSEETDRGPETMTLHPGEGGYAEALAEWDLQQDPSREAPVSTASGRDEAMALVHAVAEDPKHVADAVQGLKDPDASADAL